MRLPTKAVEAVTAEETVEMTAEAVIAETVVEGMTGDLETTTMQEKRNKF